MAVDLGRLSLRPAPILARRCNSLPPPSLSIGVSGMVICQSAFQPHASRLSTNLPSILNTRTPFSKVPRSTGSSPSNGSTEDPKSSADKEKVSFGYSRKDVLLIGLGVTLLGVGLKSGLEFIGVNALQAGNVVQLVLVLGLTVGWISTYIFRVSNKDMTYAQQLRDYEKQVMQKRLDGLTEAEVEALLEQVDEEKSREKV